MAKTLIVTLSSIALSLWVGSALAQDVGKGNSGDALAKAAAGTSDPLAGITANNKDPVGDTPPVWQGSNPPGFGVQADRQGWGGGTQPPGWTHAQNSSGWGGGTVPRGLGKR